ncbi:hypothetical protein [Bradyrhizobium sp. AZCC 1721]|uniref:hypothetical protein n=1 Tax=Bradyrhizobium sp. AZCC 1721 TaxID=3117016 RepID=UPI002FEEB5FF
MKRKARHRFRRGLYDIGDDVIVHLICPTRQVPEPRQIERSNIETKSLAVNGAAATHALLRRPISRVNRLWYGRFRLHLKLRFGWHDLRTGRPCSFAGRAVIGDRWVLYFRLVPRPMVNDQHAEHAENGDPNRNLQWRATASDQLIFSQFFRHRKICVASLLPNQIRTMPKVPIDLPEVIGTNVLAPHCRKRQPSVGERQSDRVSCKL